VGTTEGKGQLRRYRQRWDMIVKWTLVGYDVVIWTGFMWLRIGTSGGLL
jgi:hypothetical protein